MFKSLLLASLLIATAVAMLNLGRAWNPELSRKVTNVCLIVIGFSVAGLSLIGDSSASHFQSIASVLQGLGVLAGVVVAGVGLYRLKGDARNEDGTTAADVRGHADSTQAPARRARTAARRASQDDGTDEQSRLTRRGWRCIWSGLALAIVPLLFPSVRNGSLDGTTASRMVMLLIIVGAILAAYGRACVVRARNNS